MEQRLLPQMLQSIEVLQLATADLALLVEQQIETNEVLELEPLGEALAVATETAVAGAVAAQEWEAPGVRPCSDDTDGHRAMLENQPAGTDELLAHVRAETAFLGVTGELAEAVALLCGELDGRGLLTEPLAGIAADTGVAIDLLTEALSILQHLPPGGLGADGPVAAMLLQAAHDPDRALIERLLTEHLPALARNKRPEVARALSLSLDELELLVDRIGRLQPAPAARFRSEQAPVVEPDVVAWLEDGEVQVALAEDGLPRLSISQAYEALAKDREIDRGLRAHLRTKLREARDLIGAISMRQSTLLRVATGLLRHQAGFLANGRAALVPLHMTDLAAELSVHPSTISRAIAGKYVATPLGTVALRDLCQMASADASGAPSHARASVVQELADLIAHEDRSAPWSDDQLKKALLERGFRVARRTVVKFRQELGIPSSYQRRQHKGE